MQTLASMSPGLAAPAGSSTVLVREKQLDRIEHWYEVRKPKSVASFIRQHPELGDLLVEAINPLVESFGPDPVVALAVVTDPEIEEGEELFAYILTSLPSDQALRRLTDLDEKWFLRQLGRAQGRFNFNLEFR